MERVGECVEVGSLERVVHGALDRAMLHYVTLMWWPSIEHACYLWPFYIHTS